MAGGKRGIRVVSTASGTPPVRGRETAFTPTGEVDPRTGQYKDHWVLSEEERAKGFVRPLRHSYRHTRCKGVTSMGDKIAETFARDPQFYSSTFCHQCRDYYPVGEFVWEGSEEVVGA